MVTAFADISLRQEMILAIFPKVTSFLSLVGSFYIIQDILRMRNKVNRKMKTTYHRLLLGLTTCDALVSVAWFMTTWPIPRDVFPIYGALGTQQTCEAQGFFAQFSIACIFYNCSLAIYYYIVIILGWSQSRIDKSRIEIPMHLLGFMWGVATASASVALGLINPIGWDCWISAVPLGCKESFRNNGETTCTRGDNANLYQWIFFYAPLWLIVIGVTVIMTNIVCKFKRQDAKNKKYGEHDSNKRINSKISFKRKGPKNEAISALVMQSVLYVFSFFFVWIFPTILRIHEVTSDVIYYELVLVSATFVPMQGFWNMIIYITPRYRKIRRERKLRNAPQKDKAALVRTGQDMKLALKGEVPSSKNATTKVAPSTVMKVISTPTVAQEEEKARNDSDIMKGLKSIRLVFQDIKEAMRQGGDEDVLETEIYKSDLQPVLEIATESAQQEGNDEIFHENDREASFSAGSLSNNPENP